MRTTYSRAKYGLVKCDMCAVGTLATWVHTAPSQLLLGTEE